MANLSQKLREFRDDESGVAAIELTLCIPILVWALLSTMVYFDAYHHEAISTRAGLTIADMISRESGVDGVITPTYMNGAREVLRTLTETENNPDLRVTVYQYRQTENDYRVVWSKNRGYGQNYNNPRLDLIRARLPDLADGDTAILVETRTKYNAPFSVTISPFIVPDLDGIEFNSFTVIRPRFQGTVCWKQDAGAAPECYLPAP